MLEQRHSDRKRAFVGGQIIFNTRRSTLFCLVRNFSEEGAKLEVAGAATTPDEFDLQINGKAQEFHAQVIWRQPDSLGVKFVASPSDAVPPPAA